MHFDSTSRAISRRTFLGQTAALAAWAGSRGAFAANREKSSPIIDTHMHVWGHDPKQFPFVHPYNPDSPAPQSIGTAEVLLKEMDEYGVTQCVLVQAIYHGWDNSYVAHCQKEHPQRFRSHGLIDPTDPQVTDKLVFWMKEHHFSGMRFSPIYYLGKDEWINGPVHHKLWQKAGELGAIFNYFISTPQLPRLEEMIAKYTKVRIVIDHFARIDLKAADPSPEFEKLTRLAKYPNVWAKVTEMSVISPSGMYPFKDTIPWARRLYDAFGPDRLLWGTGFPGASRVENGRLALRQELDLVEKELDFLTAEDRKKLLGLNAKKLWGFPDLV